MMQNPWHILFLLVFLPFCIYAQQSPPAYLPKDPTPADWAPLAQFNNTLTRQQFENRLNTIFDPFHGLTPFLDISDKSVKIFDSAVHNVPPLVEILFAESPEKAEASTDPFRAPVEFFRLKKTSPKPLENLRIAIEPADIGGDWANMEDRSMNFRGYGVVNEGDLNLTVAKILEKQLCDLGAKVFLIRNQCAPITNLQPQQLFPEIDEVLTHKSYILPEAYFKRSRGLTPNDPRRKEIAAETLLTKTVETRARVKKVRDSFQPDITIVLQHDASDRSSRARLTPINRNIFFVHGSYTAKELALDPHQRLRLLTKLLQNVTPIETELACNIAEQFDKTTAYEPVRYGNSPTTRFVIQDYYDVVARNIAFNREHDGPVVVTEPYFMNQRITLKRLLAGDYSGTKTIDGHPYISIYQEYANAVTQGILNTYGPSRKSDIIAEITADIAAKQKAKDAKIAAAKARRHTSPEAAPAPKKTKVASSTKPRRKNRPPRS